MQMGSRIFNVVMLALPRPAFCGEHGATVDTVEIPREKSVPFLGVLVLLVVDSQVPFRVLSNAVQPDELVLFLRGGVVFPPRVPVVEYYFSLLDESQGLLERRFFQSHLP